MKLAPDLRSHLFRAQVSSIFAGTSFLILLGFIFSHPSQRWLAATTFAVFGFFLLFSSGLSLLNILEHFRRKDYNYRRVLVVGSVERARPVFERALENPHWGIKPVGFVDWDKPKWLWSYRPIPLVGLYEHLPVILTNGHIDAVLFSDLPSNPKKFLDSAETCRRIGVTAYLLSGALTGQNEDRVAPASPTFLNWPVIQLCGPLPMPFGSVVKYVFDRLAAFIALVLVSPVMAATADWIKTTSSGPVFFKELRVGQNGRKFWMYKFRTTMVGAGQGEKEPAPKNERAGPGFKMKNDPRITRVGRFLCKTSLDKLPRLFNVLWGEMSLIGPHPPLPQEVFRNQPERRRLSVRPGLISFGKFPPEQRQF